MKNPENKDKEMILLDRKAIEKNYDGINCNHTVGAAIRCKNGNVYCGVNV